MSVPAGTGAERGDEQAVAARMKAVSSSAGTAFPCRNCSIGVIELYALMQRDVHNAGAAGAIKQVNYDCNGPLALILSLVK